MTRRIYLIITLLVITTSLFAQRISKEQALEKAQTFIKAKKSNAAGAKAFKRTSDKVKISLVNDNTEYFIFNVGTDDGFIIVSGDERTPAILGYADNGTFSATDIPAALSETLEAYAEQIRTLPADMTSNSGVGASGFPAIDPLLESKWNQGNPYNLMCPEYKPDTKSATGCVATAMAQIVYFHKPEGCKALPAYTSEANNIRIEMPELPATTFDWNLIKPIYNSTNSEAENMEVAKLMLYCGQSVTMDYGASSGAPTAYIPVALTSYFGFSNKFSIEYRTGYSSNAWATLIYKELDNSRPVVFSGRNPEAGHSFLCDGYDGEGLFHINWGWGGTSNGFFLIDDLTPDTQGTGGSSGGYCMNNYAVVGIELAKGEEGPLPPLVSCKGIVSCPAEVTRFSSSSHFNADISVASFNVSDETHRFKLGWGFFDEDGNMLSAPLAFQTTEELNPNWGYNEIPVPSSFGAGITEGTYVLREMCSTDNGATWNLASGAKSAGVKVIINDNTASLSLYPGNDVLLRVNDMQVDWGKEKVGYDIRYKVNITNEGTTFSTPLYVHVDDSEKPTAGIGVNMDPGVTDDVFVSVCFNTPGEHSIKLKDTDGNILYFLLVDVADVPTYTISMGSKVLTPVVNGEISDDTYKYEYTLMNRSDVEYDDYVRMDLIKATAVVDGRYSGSIIRKEYIDTHIQPGEKLTREFEWTNLEEGCTYWCRFSYFTKNGNGYTWAGAQVGYVFTCPVQEYLPGDANKDGIVSVADIVTTANYILGTIPETFSKKNADSNGDGSITVTDIVTDAQIILGN